MTSVFDVIQFEDSNDQGKLRQAMALAHQRVEDRFGAFVRKGSVDDQAARFSLVEDDVRGVVVDACWQVGVSDTPVYEAIARNFVTSAAEPQLRTAGVRHEARKPKMCPYHSEVTDISLAAGDPSAGFNAMAQHAWSGRHCQGEEYKGDRCKFKPAMTTQTFWDEKAEKAQQRRDERAEREVQPTLEVQTLDFEDPATSEEFVDAVQDELATETPQEPSAIGEGVEEVPMAMAAKVKIADGGAIPTMDKRKWTPKTVPHDQPLKADDPDGRNPTKRKDVVDPITQKPDEPDNKSDLTEIGEQVTEHQDVAEDTGVSTSGQGGTFGGGERSAVSGLLSPGAVREALAKSRPH